MGSDGSAAGGGRSDLSEWQRSARDEGALAQRTFAGHRNRRRLIWCGAFPGRRMKREFLQSLQEDQPLSKAVIDAIMAENGKDIQATRALFADYEGLKQELESARQTIAQLEEGNQKALEEKARQVEFSYLLKQAVKDSGGRNQKAVEALLDLEDLQKADKPETALQDAMNALQKEHPWLFQTQTPPPYAAFTGTQNPKANAPATLAGALRERFERNSF